MPKGVGHREPPEQGLALAEGFYWMAEKLMWGYGDIPKNPEQALRLYRQAADLGWSDAYIRIGEFHEYGRGGAPNAAEALANYQRAVEAGNYLSLCLHRETALPHGSPGKGRRALGPLLRCVEKRSAWAT